MLHPDAYVHPEAVLIGDVEVGVAGEKLRGGMVILHLDTDQVEVEESPTLEYTPEEDYQVDF